LRWAACHHYMHMYRQLRTKEILVDWKSKVSFWRCHFVR
jgi:hypothetical protein